MSHPRSGASWEGYAIEEVLKWLRPDEAYFWATHTGAELDLLIFRQGRRFGFEFKRQDAPKLTVSMRVGVSDLKLDRLVVVYPGTRAYELSDRVAVVPLVSLASGSPDDLLKPARGAGRRPSSRGRVQSHSRRSR